MRATPSTPFVKSNINYAKGECHVFMYVLINIKHRTRKVRSITILSNRFNVLRCK